MQIFSAAESRFEATLGLPGTRFIFYETANPLCGKKTHRLMLFQPLGDRACKLDLYGRAHPEHGRAVLVGTWVLRVVADV